MLTVHKNRIVYLIKIISVIILLLIPLNMRADTPAAAETSLQVDIPADAESYNWTEIIQQLESAYNANPNNVEVRDSLTTAYNNYGLVFASKKEWIHAEAYLNKALMINPNAAAIKQNLSNIYFQHGYELYQDKAKVQYSNYAHQDAKNLANKSLSLDPNNVNALLLLGDIEYMNQQMLQAQNAWKKAASLAPNNPQLQKRLEQINRETAAESSMNSVFDPFFIIKIDPKVAQLPGIDIPKMLTEIRTKVSRDFQFTQTNKLAVIVYSKNQYQDTLQEAPDWSEAAYDGKLRIGVAMQNQNMAQLYSNVVHEYTHAVIDSITKRNIPKWLNEGLSKYEEYRYGIPPRIYVLALAYNTDSILAWDKIDESFLSADKTEALLAYQQSFSFVYFLIERYGMTKMITLLKALGEQQTIETAFNTIYQKPLAEVQKDWRIWLANFIQQWAEAPIEGAISY